MKPLISYYGGKQKIAKHIIKMIPRHTVYCEPFCGGGAVFFMKPRTKTRDSTHYREILNDTDERIITFYRCLQEEPDELIWRIKTTLYSESEYKRSGEILKNPEKYFRVERAWAYYVNIMQGFSNKLFAGWARAVFGQNRAATWKKKISCIEDYVERMAGVNISCMDALKCIAQWDSPQTCFYCDPPYPGADQGHYKGYTRDDLQRLVDILAGIQGSFLLSNYDQPDLNIPETWERFEIDTVCSASGMGKVGADRDKKATDLGDIKRTEIVWRKINRDNIRSELIPLYEGEQLAMFV